MIRVCHLLDQTLNNRVGGVEFINHLLFHDDDNPLFDHQLQDAKSFNQSEPYSFIDHFQNKGSLNKIDADIVHIHQIQPYGLKSLVELAKRKTTILTLHDYYLFCQKSTLYKNNRTLCHQANPFHCTACNFHNSKSFFLTPFFYFRSKLAKQLLHHIKKIILPNNQLLSFIPSQFHHKCIVIHYATPKTPATPVNKKHYVYLGTLAPHKGIFEFIQNLNQSNFSQELHIYSPDRLKSPMPHFVKHCGLLVDKSILCSYKALIIPSKWKETGPIVLQEALNADTEVILYNSPISKDYSQLNGVHSFSTIQQIEDFQVTSFQNNSYCFKQLKTSLEDLYQLLSKEL